MWKRTSARTPSQLQRKMVEEPPHPDLSLTYVDMSGFAADIKSTFSVTITDLKSNLLVLTEKMAAAGAAGKHREKAIHRLEKVTTSHSLPFIEINRHLEDLDKRGRRNNIRLVNHNGRQHIPRSPEDVPEFCHTLQLVSISRIGTRNSSSHPWN